MVQQGKRVPEHPYLWILFLLMLHLIRYAAARAGRKGSLEKKVSERDVDYPGQEATRCGIYREDVLATKRTFKAGAAGALFLAIQQSIGTCSVEAVSAVS